MIIFVVAVLMSAYFLFKLTTAATRGEVRFGPFNYRREISPLSYWFFVIINLTMVIFFAWLSVIVVFRPGPDA